MRATSIGGRRDGREVVSRRSERNQRREGRAERFASSVAARTFRSAHRRDFGAGARARPIWGPRWRLFRGASLSQWLLPSSRLPRSSKRHKASVSSPRAGACLASARRTSRRVASRARGWTTSSWRRRWVERTGRRQLPLNQVRAGANSQEPYFEQGEAPLAAPVMISKASFAEA